MSWTVSFDTVYFFENGTSKPGLDVRFKKMEQVNLV